MGKAGVNTSIAFSGMKKAISNWGKEGKDGRVEFKKLLKKLRKRRILLLQQRKQLKYLDLRRVLIWLMQFRTEDLNIVSF